jgi:glycosyltransferase involved in cell wall biosynthesis
MDWINAMRALLMNLTEMLCATYYVSWHRMYMWIAGSPLPSTNQPDVTFFCGYGFIPGERTWPHDMTRNCIGGSERCVIELAKQMGINQSVVIYNAWVKEDMMCDGILYKPSSSFNPFDSHRNVVFWRMPCTLLLCKVNAARTFLWIHDGPPIHALQWMWDTIGPWSVHCVVGRVHAFNSILMVFPSTHLRDMALQTYPKCAVIPNGVMRYDDMAATERKYVPGQRVRFIWTPPHDRGLVLVLREIVRLNQLFPGKLEVHVYNSSITSTNINVSDEVDRLTSELNSDGDMVYTHGFVSHHQLMSAYHSADFFVYPATVDESFSLCTHEALLAGCAVMTNSRGCFADIEKYGGRVYASNHELFVAMEETLVRFIRGKGIRGTASTSHPLAWCDVVSMWDNICL